MTLLGEPVLTDIRPNGGVQIVLEADDVEIGRWETGANGVYGGSGAVCQGGMDVTQTARWKVAQRHKRLVISRTLRDRAQRDPRRHPATTTPAAPRR
jgi:hypothetical protein